MKEFKNEVMDTVNSFFSMPTEADIQKEKLQQEKPKRPIGAVRPVFLGERKSKRCTLLLKPSIVEGLTKVVQEEGGSVNNLINEVLEEYLKKKR